MRAKIFFVTLALADLGRSVAFHRDGLGWPTEGIVGQEFHDEVTGADGTIAFFTFDGGLMLGLYARANLAKDASLPPGPPSSTKSASVSSPDRRQRSTGCSGKLKPSAARRQHPPTCARSGSTRGTSPIPMVICSRLVGTPTSRTEVMPVTVRREQAEPSRRTPGRRLGPAHWLPPFSAGNPRAGRLAAQDAARHRPPRCSQAQACVTWVSFPCRMPAAGQDRPPPPSSPGNNLLSACLAWPVRAAARGSGRGAPTPTRPPAAQVGR